MRRGGTQHAKATVTNNSMDQFKNRKVVVIGLDASGSAACELLQRAGATVIGLAVPSENPSQKGTPSGDLRGIRIHPSGEALPAVDFVVHSSQVSRQHPAVQSFVVQGIPIL